MTDPREQSLVRSIGVLALLALGVPFVLHALFERQARRLEALGDHGAPVTATVASIGADQSLFYRYVVDGQPYEWSVRRDAAPYAVGATFEAYYLPEDPSFSRPGPDRSVATLEAASNRSGTTKGLLGIFWFFGMFAAMSAIELIELRRVGVEAYTSAEGRAAGMRRRLVSMGVILLPLLFAIGYWHFRDAEAHGESPVAPLIGLVLALGVLGGTVAYALRRGPAEAQARAARLARWAAPIAIVIAILRLLAFLFGGDIG